MCMSGRVRVRVAARVIVTGRVPVTVGRAARRLDVRDDLDAPVRHAPRREQPVGHALELVAATSQDDHLEAPPVVEVHVQGRSNAVPSWC